MSQVKIGIIGGTGLENPKLFTVENEHTIETCHGTTEGTLKQGKISGVDCVLVSRHGGDHSVQPTNVNYRANLLALQKLGCTHVIATTACGSLQEHIKPGDFVVLDQFIDRTTKRAHTIYDGSEKAPKGILHLPMDTPFCPHTRDLIIETCKELSFPCHDRGTMVTIEGPRFSSRAESKMFRQWGCDVINMTTYPEVVIAKELKLCYASLAMATDYDCWREHGEAVTVNKVLELLNKNADKAIEVIKLLVTKIAEKNWDDIIKELKATVDSSLMGNS